MRGSHIFRFFTGLGSACTRPRSRLWRFGHCGLGSRGCRVSGLSSGIYEGFHKDGIRAGFTVFGFDAQLRVKVLYRSYLVLLYHSLSPAPSPPPWAARGLGFGIYGLGFFCAGLHSSFFPSGPPPGYAQRSVRRWLSEGSECLGVLRILLVSKLGFVCLVFGQEFVC